VLLVGVLGELRVHGRLFLKNNLVYQQESRQ
jgi:hypothetical protein